MEQNSQKIMQELNQDQDQNQNLNQGPYQKQDPDQKTCTNIQIISSPDEENGKWESDFLIKAFSPGYDLWVVPEFSSSSISNKIDWLLNFRLSNSNLKIPSGNSESPLLVPSSRTFPNRWVLQLNGLNDLSQWCQRLKSIWNDLGRPSVRIFLPKGANQELFFKEWTQSNE